MRAIYVILILILGILVLYIIKPSATLNNFNVYNFITKEKIKCKDCNVIIAVVDALGAEHLPCYGYKTNTMPRLCRFAEENIFFKEAYSNATFSLPAHISIFTGQFPHTHQMLKTFSNISFDTSSFLPETLRKHGYKNILLFPYPSDPFFPDNLYGSTRYEAMDEYTHSWESALKKFKANLEKGEKTFIFLHTYKAHEPYTNSKNKNIKTIPNELKNIDETMWEINELMVDHIIDQMGADIKTGGYGNKTEFYTSILNNLRLLKNNKPDAIAYIKSKTRFFKWYILTKNWRDKIDINNPAHLAYLRSRYDNSLSEVDNNEINELINFYSSESISKNTILIILSDHGEELMEHGEFGHETLYDVNIHTPLIMSIPRVKSKEINTPVQHVDIAPTILDLLNIDSDIKFDGHSLVPLFLGNNINERILLSENIDLKKIALRYEDWKLHLNRDNNGQYIPTELYSYKEDKLEKNNLINSKLDIARSIFQKYSVESNYISR